MKHSKKAVAPSTITEQALAKLITALPLMIKYQEASAQIARAKYLALVKSGFTEQQALELCNK